MNQYYIARYRRSQDYIARDRMNQDYIARDRRNQDYNTRDRRIKDYIAGRGKASILSLGGRRNQNYRYGQEKPELSLGAG